MGGAPILKWDVIGFDPQPCGSEAPANLHAESHGAGVEGTLSHLGSFARIGFEMKPSTFLDLAKNSRRGAVTDPEPWLSHAYSN